MVTGKYHLNSKNLSGKHLLKKPRTSMYTILMFQINHYHNRQSTRHALCCLGFKMIDYLNTLLGNKCTMFLCHSSAWGPTWSWSYGSWIYNYLCNQRLSPLKLWVRTPHMARCTWYNIMWKSLSVDSGLHPPIKLTATI